MKKKTNDIKPNGFPVLSASMRSVMEEIYAFAYHKRSCLILGPTGSGKEFAARYYHQVYKKYYNPKAPFVSLNCSELTPNIARTELFGYVKGAFTDAKQDKPGLFETASGGILFLDEMGDLPVEVQPMLLRALDSEIREATRLGGVVPYKTDDIVVLGATDRALDHLRPALHNRFGMIINVPGVKDRIEDIRGAVRYFTIDSVRFRRDVKELLLALFGSDDEEVIPEYNNMKPSEFLSEKITSKIYLDIENRDWPGNFREIKNAVDKAIIRAGISSDIDEFVQEVAYYYRLYFPVKSNRSATAELLSGNYYEKKIADRDLDEGLFKIIQKALPGIAQDEQTLWTQLLSVVGHDPFRIMDILSLFPGVERRTLLNRINPLIEANLLRRGGGRGDIYHRTLLTAVSNEHSKRNGSFLPFRSIDQCELNWKNNAEDIAGMLHKTRCVFVSTGEMEDKEDFILCLADNLSKIAMVFYYRIDEHGLVPLLDAFEKELESQQITPQNKDIVQSENHHDIKAASLSGYISIYLQNNTKPTLVLDNVDNLRSKEEINTLNIILEYWTSFAFVLSGKKLSNQIKQGSELGLVEYKVG